MCFQKFPGQWHHEKNACLLLPRQVLGEVRRFTLLCFASSGEVRHSRLNFSENYSNSSAVQRCNCTFKALQEVAWFADTSDRSQHPLQCSHFYKPNDVRGRFWMLRTFVHLTCGSMSHTTARQGLSTERVLPLQGGSWAPGHRVPPVIHPLGPGIASMFLI